MRTTVTLAGLLQSHARKFPDRLAYTFLADGENESGSLSYGQLDAKVRSTANMLSQEAVSGDRAILLYPVGLDYLVAFLSCLYAGIIAVPAYPLRAGNRSGARIRKMIDDCSPRLVLSCERLLAGTKSALAEVEGGTTLHVLRTDVISYEAASTDAFDDRCDDSKVAFLQYTSASITEPKGVRVTHGNLMANQSMIQRAMGHDEQSSFVSWLPPYHDMGLVGNLLHPLYLGSSCVFMPPTAFVQKPSRWLSAISKYRGRTSGAPTFGYDLCVRKAAEHQTEGLDLSSWRIAYCGAEMVDSRVLESFAARFAAQGFRRSSIYPCYGLAEATLLVSGRAEHDDMLVAEVDPDSLEKGVLTECPDGRRQIVSCGVPTPESGVAIADPISGEEKPESQVGEIWVTGNHVTDGYWNRPDLSREAFGARLRGRPGTYLRTGDLGVLLRGQLYVVGRIKEVVVYQGRNIHPTDVEQIVTRASDGQIDGCAAFAIPSDSTEGIGIVIEVGRRLDPSAMDAIGEAVAWDVYRQLEVWPSRIAFVKKGGIPRTSSGKKQRLTCSRQLLSGELATIAEWQGTSAENAFEEESQPGYEWLVRLISQFTGLSSQLIVDNNSGAESWGLDSLRTVEILHHVERRTGAHIPASFFYENNSFHAITQEIGRESRRAAHHGHREKAVHQQDESSETLVTPGQEALWFSQQIDPDSAAFHLSWTLKTGTALDPKRLQDAVRTVIARHDVLRWTFHLSPEGLVTRHTLQPDSLDYEFLEAPAESVMAWIDCENSRPFDLAKDLLVRVRHGSGTDGDYLAFCLHHLVADLWSCALFTEQVLDQYQIGSPAERVRSYQQYCRHVRRIEEDGEDTRNYWRSQLVGAGVVDPVDVMARSTRRPLVRSYEGACLTTTLGEKESSLLLDSARDLGVSRQMLILAIYGVLLWSMTDLEDFLSGCMSSGRSRESFSRMQGLFSNPFAVRFRFARRPTLEEVVVGVRDQVLGALKREDYPFQAVVNDVQPHRDLGRTPLFQNMFVYQQLPESSKLSPCVLGGEQPPFKHRGLEIRCVPLPVRWARYDLTMYCIEVERRLKCQIVYSTALFEEPKIAAMMNRFELLLSKLPLTPSSVLTRESAHESKR